MEEGLIIEDTGWRKRHLYSLPHLEPLQTIAPPQHSVLGRKRGRPFKAPVETAVPQDLFTETLNPKLRKSFDPGVRDAPLLKIEFHCCPAINRTNSIG